MDFAINILDNKSIFSTIVENGYFLLLEYKYFKIFYCNNFSLKVFHVTKIN